MGEPLLRSSGRRIICCIKFSRFWDDEYFYSEIKIFEDLVQLVQFCTHLTRVLVLGLRGCLVMSILWAQSNSGPLGHWHGDCVLKVSSTRPHVTCLSLNGSNGSYSGTNHHGGDGSGNSNAKTNHKAAEKRVNAKGLGDNGGKQTKVQPGPPVETLPDKVEVKKVPQLVLCGSDVDKGVIFFDGSLRSRPPNVEIQPHGTVVNNVGKQGPGWCRRDTGKEQIFLSRAVETHSRDGKDYEVFVPAWTYLSGQANVREITEAYLNGVIILMNKMFGNPLDQTINLIFESTIIYWVRMNREQKSSIHDALISRSGAKVLLIGAYTPFLFDQIGHIHELEPKRVPAIQGPAVDYPRKAIFKKIVYREGSNKNAWPVEDPLVFKTLVGPTPRFYRTQFFRLRGDKNFVQYDNTGHNMIAGLKRIDGARDNEDILSGNQLGVVANLRHVIGWRSSFIATDDQVEVIALHLLGSEDQDKATAWLLPGIQKLVGEVSRSRISLLDTVSRTSDAILDASATASGLVHSALDSAWAYIARDHMANVPHVKRNLRKAYVKGEQVHTTTGILCPRVAANVKNETAKPGKPSRLFISYGAGCMYANHIPDLVKTCINGTHTFFTGEGYPKMKLDVWILAKEPDKQLKLVFESLQAAACCPNYMLVVIYSDDMVCAGSVDGKSFMYNLDIKSCDSSNAELIFEIIYNMNANFSLDYANGLMQQCQQPIHMVNPSDTSEEFILHLTRAFEGSGTVLTTILNHIASYCIALSIGYYMTRLAPEQAITNGAALVGHMVTSEHALSVEHLQFLKYSPILATRGTVRKLIPMRNLGAILRNLGSIDGDLLPKHLGMSPSEFSALPNAKRMDLFFGAVINSYKNEPQSQVMQALRIRFPFAGSVPDYQSPHAITSTIDYSDWIVDESSLCVRYGVENFNDLSLVIGNLEVGDTYTLSSLAAIFRVDYSL